MTLYRSFGYFGKGIVIKGRLYVRVVEGHAGTADDPIPYDGNMALTGGLYYTQDGTVYLCVRDTGTAVYHALADLTGTYVEAV